MALGRVLLFWPAWPTAGACAGCLARLCVVSGLPSAGQLRIATTAANLVQAILSACSLPDPPRMHCVLTAVDCQPPLHCADRC